MATTREVKQHIKLAVSSKCTPSPVDEVQYSLRSSTSTDIPSTLDLLTKNEGKISCIVGHRGTGKTIFLQSLLTKWAEREEDDDTICLYLDVRNLTKKQNRQSDECTSEQLDSFKDSGVAESCTSKLLDSFTDKTGEDYSAADFLELFRKTRLYAEFLDAKLWQEISRMVTQHQGRYVTIIIDHYAEDITSTGTSSQVIGLLLRRKLLPLATIFVAGQFSTLNSLTDITALASPCNIYTLEGIKSGHEALLHHLGIQFKSDCAAEWIQCHCPELCSVPGMAVSILKNFTNKTPKTFTETIEALIMDTIRRQDKSTSRELESLSTIPQDLADRLRLLGKLAYQSIESETDYYSSVDLSNHTLGSHHFSELCDTGLLLPTVTSASKTGNDFMYAFPHRVIKHFLAAYYLASAPIFYQINEFHRNASLILFDAKHSEFSKLYFGMAHILHAKSSPTNLLEKNFEPPLKTILETEVGGKLQAVDRQSVKTRKLTFVFQLLQECQDKTLMSRFLSKQDRKYLQLHLSASTLTNPFIKTLAYVMGNSGISKWNIVTPESNTHIIKEITKLAKEHNPKILINIELDRTGGEKLELRAELRSTNVQPKKFPSSTAHVRCLREILHPILERYSPVKLKSSSNEPSYVSFLVCDCLRARLEKEKLLQIEPINAIHWVSAPIKPQSDNWNMTSDEVKLRQHVHEKHKMEQLELVMMIWPLPLKISYKHDNEFETIDLSKNFDPHPMEGKIAADLKEQLIGCDFQDECVVAMETCTRSVSTERVVLPLLIPPSFKEIMTHVVLFQQRAQTFSDYAAEQNNSKETGVQVENKAAYSSGQAENKATYSSQNSQEAYGAKYEHVRTEKHPFEGNAGAHGTSYNNGSTTNFNSPHSIRCSVQPSASQMPQFDLQHNTRIPVVHSPTFGTQQGFEINTPYNRSNLSLHSSLHHTTQSSVQESVRPSVQQNLSTGTQKQYASPPGTVLHSTDPSAFKVDAVYNMPDEKVCLKKGGNGVVFLAKYGSKEYAVKKTAYRSREFNIHKKLKHPNVIELCCYMFGTQQPLQRKRYYSYHFMPRVSGDLARMVTDKAELTMQSLSSKYKNDPRKLGSIQGNWKYILKELLKGLAYLHSLNIIHRDVKASNVLIKMLCSCDNPLTCVCSQKCLVRISDFDAALELDSTGSLQPTIIPARSSNSAPGSNGGVRRVYQISPVGTDGYRSPESFQLVLSNDASAFNPPLTMKSDIWSVGLILLRMLNGSNGPTSQQKVSNCNNVVSQLIISGTAKI